MKKSIILILFLFVCFHINAQVKIEPVKIKADTSKSITITNPDDYWPTLDAPIIYDLPIERTIYLPYMQPVTIGLPKVYIVNNSILADYPTTIYVTKGDYKKYIAGINITIICIDCKK